MRTRPGAQFTESRGTATWNDWFDPIDGGGDGDGGSASPQEPCSGAGRAGRGGEDALGETSGPDALEGLTDCPGGVCPVPWATTVEHPPVIQAEQVMHPSHYNEGGIECLEAIEAQLTHEEYRGFLKGNIAKYVWRERYKGGTESLKKAQFYMERLIDLDEAQNG